VVEPRHDHLVSLAPSTRGRAREREVQRRHVGAEDDLVGRAPEEGGAGQPRIGDEGVGASRCLEVAADVRVRLAHVRRDCVDHHVRDLRSAGPVEESEPATKG
jgi:hypothetical protein